MLCNKQYVGKAETGFNIRLNNNRKDTKNPNAILACKHFQQQGHNFNSHAKFINIDKLIAWIQKLKTLVPYGLNQKLSKSEMTTLALPFHVHFDLDHSSQVTLELR